MKEDAVSLCHWKDQRRMVHNQEDRHFHWDSYPLKIILLKKKIEKDLKESEL